MTETTEHIDIHSGKKHTLEQCYYINPFQDISIYYLGKLELPNGKVINNVRVHESDFKALRDSGCFKPVKRVEVNKEWLLLGK